MTDAPLKILSLGAGVQSTTVALMSAFGELDRFDACISADTGWEPAQVYDHLAALTAFLDTEAQIPVYVVSAGNIRQDHADPQEDHLFIRNPRKHPEWLGKQRSFMPFFTITQEGDAGRVLGEDDSDDGAPIETTSVVLGRKGRTRRTCTKTYKIEPVEKKIRELLGLRSGQRWPTHHAVIQTFGISWDESQRMSDPSRSCITHDYPLIDRRMTRDDCHAWMADHGWTAPRSACIGCPFHRNDEWRRMKAEAPDEWADAVAFDHQVRQRQIDGLMALQSIPYIHDQRVPLEQADISDRSDTQPTFEEACEGFCGT